MRPETTQKLQTLHQKLSTNFPIEPPKLVLPKDSHDFLLDLFF